jgi:hypothetical protein
MEGNATKKLTQKAIFLFWVPLAATWLMMAAEGPFLTAVIARLHEPQNNLAAWGVAFVLAVFFESPIIMIMSASTALAKDRDSFKKLRNFTFAANAVITLVMLLTLVTPLFDLLMHDLIGLPKEVSKLVYGALFILLPWPGAIGYRRFYQGLLIRNNQTRLVAMGTVIRMTSMGASALVLYFLFDLPGAHVGAFAASTGVLLEAVASRIMAGSAIEKLREQSEGEPLTYRGIFRFYSPLAVTSMITIASHPLITFFVGHSRHSLESLAVMPVVNSLTFLFRALGISFQEVGIALMGEKNENYRELRKFSLLLGLAVSVVLVTIAFTPLARIWFRDVSGLTTALLVFTAVPICIQSLIPFFEVILSFQRAVIVKSGRTTHITFATVTDVCAIIAALLLAINGLNMVGVTAAAIAMLAGRTAANLYLVPPQLRAARAFESTKKNKG